MRPSSPGLPYVIVSEGSLPGSTGAISSRACGSRSWQARPGPGQFRPIRCAAISLRLPVSFGDALHAGRLAYMDSPLGAPGGLGGSLLVQLCMKGAQLAFAWFPGSA
jgi:hypothetical protein